MANRVTHKLLATTGKYKGADGTEKKRYLQVGVLFTGDDGRMSIKLDAVPVGPEWSGYLSVFPMDDDRPPQREAPPSRTVQQRPAPRPSRQEPPDEPIANGMEDSEIPF